MTTKIYKSGGGYVVVRTGQPSDAVEIGIGSSESAAAENLEATAIQSVGRDSGEARAIAWAIGQGWFGDGFTTDSLVEI